MAIRRFLGALALGLTLLVLGGPAPAQADCPPGSGIEVPFLTPEELECQQTTLNATVAYLVEIIHARQNCHLSLLTGALRVDRVDCKATLETGTGDDQTDAKLRRAEARLTRRILTKCTGISLETMGFPLFCPDFSGPPYDAFDHNLCLQAASKDLVQFILDVEHPPFDGRGLEEIEIYCQDFLARNASSMVTVELDERGKCLFKQLQRIEDERTDCRNELDPQFPDTGRQLTDNAVVGAHNQILRAIPNHCPAIDLSELNFPHLCPHPVLDILQVFSLPALTECLFDTHHRGLIRFIDILFPCSTKCSNGILDFTEECDDGDNIYNAGELCRINCTLVPCGDTDDNGVRNATDSLFILRAAVGLESCDLAICDVTGDGRIRATDALRHLQFVIGLPVTLDCPIVSVTCGNGFLEAPLEQCDDGDKMFMFGEFCNATCQLVACGDPDDSGFINVLDAQYVLNAAVENVPCDLEVCDVTGNRDINSTDALRVLMRSVGLFAAFNCPPPPPTPVLPD